MTSNQPNPASATADGQWTVRRILEWTAAHLAKHGSDTPRLDAEILLAYARHCPRIELYTRFAEVVSEPERRVMRELVSRRALAEPVAYLVGHREFFGLDFQVTPDVLIPRPDTETLVVELIELAKTLEAPAILDVGTGSGCIAVAAAVNLPRSQITATDFHEPALEVARRNAERHGVVGRIHFLRGDLLTLLSADERFDFIVSNPPYVADRENKDLEPDVRLHEPHVALFAGDDGLTVIRRLIETAPPHLNAGGRLLIEISPEQAASVDRLLDESGRFHEKVFFKDLTGRPRVVSACRK